MTQVAIREFGQTNSVCAAKPFSSINTDFSTNMENPWGTGLHLRHLWSCVAAFIIAYRLICLCSGFVWFDAMFIRLVTMGTPLTRYVGAGSVEN